MRLTSAMRWVAASALVVLGACDSTTASAVGDEPEMEVAAAGDDPATPSPASPDDGTTQGTAQGTVRFRARAFVQTRTGTWVELTNGSFQEVNVAASGAASTARVVTRSRVAADSYTRVRLVFRDVRADVQGGVQAGLLTGTVTVLAGGGDIVVEREIDVSARARTRSRLLVDLNSTAWLNQASAESRTVSAAAFASAVSVVAR